MPNISELRLLIAMTELSRSRLMTAGNGLMSKSCSKGLGMCSGRIFYRIDGRAWTLRRKFVGDAAGAGFALSNVDGQVDGSGCPYWARRCANAARDGAHRLREGAQWPLAGDQAASGSAHAQEVERRRAPTGDGARQRLAL